MFQFLKHIIDTVKFTFLNLHESISLSILRENNYYKVCVYPSHPCLYYLWIHKQTYGINIYALNFFHKW